MNGFFCLASFTAPTTTATHNSEYKQDGKRYHTSDNNPYTSLGKSAEAVRVCRHITECKKGCTCTTGHIGTPCW